MHHDYFWTDRLRMGKALNRNEIGEQTLLFLVLWRIGLLLQATQHWIIPMKQKM